MYSIYLSVGVLESGELYVVFSFSVTGIFLLSLCISRSNYLPSIVYLEYENYLKKGRAKGNLYMYCTYVDWVRKHMGRGISCITLTLLSCLDYISFI